MAWGREPAGWIGGVLAALCVFCLLKTCKYILSCTEYFVSEQEVYNATHLKPAMMAD